MEQGPEREHYVEDGTPSDATYPWPVIAWPSEWGGHVATPDAPDALWSSVRSTTWGWRRPTNTAPRHVSWSAGGWVPANYEWSV